MRENLKFAVIVPCDSHTQFSVYHFKYLVPSSISILLLKVGDTQFRTSES